MIRRKQNTSLPAFLSSADPNDPGVLDPTAELARRQGAVDRGSAGFMDCLDDDPLNTKFERRVNRRNEKDQKK